MTAWATNAQNGAIPNISNIDKPTLIQIIRRDGRDIQSNTKILSRLDWAISIPFGPNKSGHCLQTLIACIRYTTPIPMNLHECLSDNKMILQIWKNFILFLLYPIGPRFAICLAKIELAKISVLTLIDRHVGQQGFRFSNGKKILTNSLPIFPKTLAFWRSASKYECTKMKRCAMNLESGQIETQIHDLTLLNNVESTLHDDIKYIFMRFSRLLSDEDTVTMSCADAAHGVQNGCPVDLWACTGNQP